MEVRLNHRVEGLAVEDGVCRGIRVGGRVQSGDRVIVTTGGLSYPATGSTGDGYGWARECGHKITDLSPALVPFEAGGTGYGKRTAGACPLRTWRRPYAGRKELYWDFGKCCSHMARQRPAAPGAPAHLQPRVAIRKQPAAGH